MAKSKPKKVTKKAKRKGSRQPVQFVRHPDTDLDIDGLRLHKSTGSYYRIASDGKSRVYYKKNGLKGIAYLRRAIYEHECWQNGNTPTDTIEIPVTAPAFDDFGAEIPAVATLEEDGTANLIRYISKDDLAAYFRDQLSNPETRAEFANAVGIPELINLHSLPPVAAPLPLEVIIKEYINGKVFKYQRQYDDAETAWGLFSDSVGVENLEDIDPTHLSKYHKSLRTLPTPRTQENHFKTVNGILNYASALHKTKRQVITDLKHDLKGLVKPEQKSEPQPNPWKVEEYHSMVNLVNEDPLWNAIFVTTLNLGLHGGEMCDLLLSEFDLESNSFRSTRTKTGVARVAYLWSRTVDSIRQWMDTELYQRKAKDRLFFDEYGNYNIRRVNAKIRKLRKDVGLKVVFDGIRDLTRTAAGAENVVAIRWIMGHTMGVDDNYAFREAAETKSVLEKVEQVVFGYKAEN